MTSGGRTTRRAALPAPKIDIPVVPEHVVRRRRITEILDTDVTSTIVVCAPAGYGKTTVLADWAAGYASRDGGRVAWVRLDSEDNDVFRFWSAILESLDQIAGWRGEILARLSPPRKKTEIAFLAALIDAIDGQNEVIHIVIDDVHRLERLGSASSLDALLNHLPRKLRVILASRWDPPLDAVRRLRLAGRSRDISTEVLAFDRQEAAGVLARHGVFLIDSDLDLMMCHTQGWPAAFRLAGLSFADTDDISAAVGEFIDNNKSVADYLFGEILSQYPEHVRRFILATSICERFTIELAEMVTGYTAAPIVDRLRQSNILTSVIDQRHHWYHYHPLLRNYLYSELNRRRVAESLHLKVSVWARSQDDPVAALEHAIAGGDLAMTADLISEYGFKFIFSGEGDNLRRLLDTLPTEFFNEPTIAIIAAFASLAVANVAASDIFLSRITDRDSSLTNPSLQLLAIVDVWRALYRGGLSQALSRLTDRTDNEREDSNVDPLFLATRGMANTILGNLHMAHEDLQRSYEIARKNDYDYLVVVCLGYLADINLAYGDFAHAGKLAVEAMEIVDSPGRDRSYQIAHACAVAAWAAWHRADSSSVRHFVPLSLHHAQGSLDPRVELMIRCIDAIVRFEDGDQYSAFHDWVEAWERLDDRDLSPFLVAYAMPIQARMAQILNEDSRGTEAIDRLSSISGSEGDIAVLRANTNIRRGRSELARRILSPVLSGEVSPLAVTATIDAWLAEAVLANLGAESDRARQAIESALDLAIPRGALRCFVDAGQPLRNLLASLVGRLGRRDHGISAVLAAMPGIDLPLEHLTPRERQLLAELPSMRTVEQMAEDFYLSASTVKTHLRGIYRKLGVGTRRDAVIEARRRGLI